MTRAITIIALTCFLVVGAAATSILGRDSVPAAGPELASPVVQSPVSNREAKKDRLAVAALRAGVVRSAARPPSIERAAAAGLCLGSARRHRGAEDRQRPHAARRRCRRSRSSPPSRPPQKSYALLSDAQIAGIKERLKLSSDQESYWPAVETALRAVARKIHATRQADPNATGTPIDPDAAEVQQLKSAAMPLLFQLREDQKQEVRTLARLIGLEKVAAQI